MSVDAEPEDDDEEEDDLLVQLQKLKQAKKTVEDAGIGEQPNPLYDI